MKLRKKRSVHLIITTIMLALPASAVALNSATTVAGSPADTQSTTIHLQVTPRRMSYAHRVTVSGRAPRSAAGRTLVLQAAATPAADRPAAARPAAAWRPLAVTRVGTAGGFALQAVLRRSGFVRVVDAAATSRAAGPSQAPQAPGGSRLPGASGVPVLAGGRAGAPASRASVLVTTRPQAVTVAARLNVAARSRDVLGGGALAVSGALLPAVAQRTVRLQGHFASGWRALGSARTGPKGGFELHGRVASGLQRRLRVLFAGDHTNAASVRSAGRVTVYGQGVASWYDDSGSTACGFHAGLGVANLSLPCGTRVRFRYGSRSVTAVVDDRGPYVGGRQWDLNQNTAAALGFSGVGPVWSTQ